MSQIAMVVELPVVQSSRVDLLYVAGDVFHCRVGVEDVHLEVNGIGWYTLEAVVGDRLTSSVMAFVRVNIEWSEGSRGPMATQTSSAFVSFSQIYLAMINIESGTLVACKVMSGMAIVADTNMTVTNTLVLSNSTVPCENDNVEFLRATESARSRIVVSSTTMRLHAARPANSLFLLEIPAVDRVQVQVRNSTFTFYVYHVNCRGGIKCDGVCVFVSNICR